MSLQFSNTTTKRGIIQEIESECGFNDGEISGNSLRLKKFTAAVNNSLDAAFSIIFKAGGKWQFDDSNHTDFNIIQTDIVSGQRSYLFTNDEGGNLILTFDKVFRAISNGGVQSEIYPVDPVTERGSETITDELGATGIPNSYDKLANGFQFDVIPNYNATLGITLYISREASYFATTDTTKKPGFNGLYHRWCVVVPALEYARRYLSQRRINNLKEEKMQLEKDLEMAYGRRARDEKSVLRPRKLNGLTGKYYNEIHN